MRDLYIVVIKFSQISGYKILAVLGNTQFMKPNELSGDFFRASFQQTVKYTDFYFFQNFIYEQDKQHIVKKSF